MPPVLGSSYSHKRGSWSPDEDKLLLELVDKQKTVKWVEIAGKLGTRTSKQCRERYHQKLKPSLSHAPITPEEGEEIERLVAMYGKRWAEISRHLKGRSDNVIKNWWNASTNRRRLNVEARNQPANPSPNQLQQPFQPLPNNPQQIQQIQQIQQPQQLQQIQPHLKQALHQQQPAQPIQQTAVTSLNQLTPQPLSRRGSAVPGASGPYPQQPVQQGATPTYTQGPPSPSTTPLSTLAAAAQPHGAGLTGRPLSPPPASAPASSTAFAPGPGRLGVPTAPHNSHFRRYSAQPMGQLSSSLFGSPGSGLPPLASLRGSPPPVGISFNPTYLESSAGHQASASTTPQASTGDSLAPLEPALCPGAPDQLWNRHAPRRRFNSEFGPYHRRGMGENNPSMDLFSLSRYSLSASSHASSPDSSMIAPTPVASLSPSAASPSPPLQLPAIKGTQNQLPSITIFSVDAPDLKK